MSIPEIHTLTGAYALDALTETERVSFERHLPECQACQIESRSLQTAAATLAALVPTATSPSLRERVLAEARTTRQLPARAPRDRTRDRPRPATNRLWMTVAATLAVIATGLGAVAVNAQQRAEQAERQVAQLSTDAPDLQIVSGAVRSGGTATLVAAGDRAVFAATDLLAPDADRAYQLWVISAGAAHSLGVPRFDPSGRLEHTVRPLLPGEAIALTVEPAGGSERPTTMPLVTLAVPA